MKLAREPLAALREDGLDAMLRAHWEEVAHDRDEIALEPDWARYAALEREGGFLAFGLRTDERELVGYTAFFVSRGLHYSAHLFALNDVIYLKPSHRGVDGVAMILAGERELRAMGVTKVVYHTKADILLGEDGDSLDALEQLVDLQDQYDVTLPDDLPLTGTLGEVLAALSYRHAENTYDKLLGSKSP